MRLGVSEHLKSANFFHALFPKNLNSKKPILLEIAMKIGKALDIKDILIPKYLMHALTDPIMLFFRVFIFVYFVINFIILYFKWNVTRGILIIFPLLIFPILKKKLN